MELLDVNSDGYIDLWAHDAESGINQTYVLLNLDGMFSNVKRINMPPHIDYTDAMDVVLHKGHLYSTHIKLDYDKREYYWGNAIKKWNLETGKSEIIYSHDGPYDNCGEYRAGGVATWIEWLNIENDQIMPKNSCLGIKVDL